MKTSNSGGNHKRKQPKKMLFEFDKKLERHSGSIEDRVFDRKARRETLNRGEFIPPSGTLFEAIFKELKQKEEREKNRHSLSNMISRLRARRAKKQTTEPVQNA